MVSPHLTHPQILGTNGQGFRHWYKTHLWMGPVVVRHDLYHVQFGWDDYGRAAEISCASGVHLWDLPLEYWVTD